MSVYAAAFAQTPPAINKTQARLELARILLDGKRYDEAAAEYRVILNENAGNRDAAVNLSKALFWSGKAKEAGDAIRGVAIDQLSAADKLHVADVLVANKDLDGAEKIYLEQLAQQDDAAVRLKLADLQTWGKKYDAALENFAVLVKARPDDRELRRKYGMVLSWAGRREQAIEELRRSLDEK